MRLKQEIQDFWSNESGIGVVEIILILVNIYTTKNICVLCE